MKVINSIILVGPERFQENLFVLFTELVELGWKVVGGFETS
jgi:hypothetical protein